MTFDPADLALDLYSNASGRLAVVLDDETLILVDGRRLSFEAVGDRWEYEREATSDDLSAEQVEVVLSIVSEVEAFDSANAVRVEARLAREAEERRVKEAAERRRRMNRMRRLEREFRRALSARA